MTRSAHPLILAATCVLAASPDLDPAGHAQAVAAFGALAPTLLCGGHLSPAGPELFAQLIRRAARLPEEGEVPVPDQAEFEAMMLALHGA